MNVVDHGMQIQEAVNAPRFHHQWLPDQITVEPFALSPDTAKLLTDMEHKIVEQSPWGRRKPFSSGLPKLQRSRGRLRAMMRWREASQFQEDYMAPMMTGDRRVGLVR